MFLNWTQSKPWTSIGQNNLSKEHIERFVTGSVLNTFNKLEVLFEGLQGYHQFFLASTLFCRLSHLFFIQREWNENWCKLHLSVLKNKTTVHVLRTWKPKCFLEVIVYPENLATGQVDPRFPWVSSVLKQILRLLQYSAFQCFSCSPVKNNFLSIWNTLGEPVLYVRVFLNLSGSKLV
jgi:hypothetical protein